MMHFDPDELAGLLDRARSDPFGILEEMRSGNTELLVAYAAGDTLPSLEEWFTPIEPGWVADEERSGPLGRSSVGVEWSFNGVHDRDGDFNGLAASFRQVEVRGFSILGVEEDRFVVRRYVDWAGLFGQLHLSLSWRIPLPND